MMVQEQTDEKRTVQDEIYQVAIKIRLRKVKCSDVATNSKIK
jgi:hypothetical protein